MYNQVTKTAAGATSCSVVEKETILKKIEERLKAFSPTKTADFFALETVKQALVAAHSGSYGVGAILADEVTGEIVCCGHNKVFTYHRSDMHAEMDLLNEFETRNGAKSRAILKQLTLYSSLESCPMCLCRILTAGVSKMYHIADDEKGGMVHLHKQLPEIWQSIYQGRIFEKADCSSELSSLALEIFLATADLDNKLIVK